MGTKFNCSKLLDKMPMINPNKLKVIQFISSRTSIQTGWEMLNGTKRNDVASIITPIMNDFVAAAPTYPIVISKNETGADKCS